MESRHNRRRLFIELVLNELEHVEWIDGRATAPISAADVTQHWEELEPSDQQMAGPSFELFVTSLRSKQGALIFDALADLRALLGVGRLPLDEGLPSWAQSYFAELPVWRQDSEILAFEPDAGLATRVARADRERLSSVKSCAELIIQAVEEMGQDPSATSASRREKLQGVLWQTLGELTADDPDDARAFETLVGARTRSHPTTGQEEIAETGNVWRKTSGVLALVLAAALVLGVWSHKSDQDETRAQRAQLAGQGTQPSIERPIVVEQVAHTGSVAPGKPFRAIIRAPEADGMEWFVTVEQAESFAHDPHTPVFTRDNLRQGFSLNVQGDTSLKMTWSTP